MESISDLFQKKKDGSIYKWKHYLLIYEQLFQSFKKDNIKILEIGVLRGGSLRLWKDYFGKNSVVYGIDIDPEAKIYEGEGIHVFIGDQGDPKFLQEVIHVAGEFDIVIDDGAHTNYMISTAFEVLYPRTKKLYIVEDTHALYWWFGMYSFLKDIGFIVSGNRNVNEKIRHLARFIKRIIQNKLSFIRLTKKSTDKLTTSIHGFYKGFISGKENLNENMLDTECISIYDSLIVYKKGVKTEKKAEIR
jgi:23S rRNA U2552 (ribose-2'-O)-methylase RlmE/FtsJ